MRIVQRMARFSDDMESRYLLEITNDYYGFTRSHKSITFLMLNPSTADETKNDPTVERCCRRAEDLGSSRVIITNLFTLRSTDPSALYEWRMTTAEFDMNVTHIADAVEKSSMCILAWGRHGKLDSMDRRVTNALMGYGYGDKLYALDLTKDGTPKHPLYLPYSLKPRRVRYIGEAKFEFREAK